MPRRSDSLSLAQARRIALAAQGFGVVVNGRAPDVVANAVGGIRGAAVGFAGSPADPDVAEALIDRCVSEFGGIHALVNCAGTAEPVGSSILTVTSAEFRNLLDAHLLTTFETCRAAAPRMVAPPEREPSQMNKAPPAIYRLACQFLANTDIQR